MTKKRNTPYPLRLDPLMRARAQEQARSERRSFNAWLQIAVEEKLDRYKEQEKVA